jgi:RNA polymerase sigma-70 factor (ECF subfamily)
MHHGTDPARRAAAERFVRLYWDPIFHYLRRKGQPVERAEDLTQDFFLRVWERDLFRTAEAPRGRFRNLLRTVLDRFLADHGPRRAPRKLTFEERHLSIQGLITDEHRSYEPASTETPEEVFDRRWAAVLWGNVLRRLKEQYASEGRAEWLELFLAYEAPPDRGSSQEPDRGSSQVAVAARFGISRDQLRDRVAKVRQRINGLLRTELREQLGDAADLEAEMRDLGRLLENPTSHRCSNV